MLDRPNPAAAQREAFRADVIEGLSRPTRTLPSRWLYDDRGSELFEAITRLPEYYPTRTETSILMEQAEAMAAFCGPRVTLIEYGAGASLKTEILIAALAEPAVYAPVDIAGDFLLAAAARVESRFPWLEIRPVVADFTADFELPRGLPALNRRVGFFPGSTIGNLTPHEAVAFLDRMRGHVDGTDAGEAGRAIVGVDLVKDLETLLAAYDDAAGVTAAFNLNLLARVVRELGAEADLDGFAHEARWNAAESAVEMHLVATSAQEIRLDGEIFRFRAGETIHTESSRKHTVEGFGRLAAAAGWDLGEVWTDADEAFAVAGLV
ncbi:L-histidine N(alpha)-methyltransferase [Methylopila turkensis]|uniref:Dimethylhistidine N-methyltransferase n=1 Tax=Methylopila turkensis TaxID=1437816 RepID=A0A9W6N6B8_9HYPH|nr:L-histidine N(alpha)-methyltransferase [Methylopila turkensis]GLK80064.1 dimethylhistidine N-methyltransferase [Methylopila turkensis]